MKKYGLAKLDFVFGEVDPNYWTTGLRFLDRGRGLF